MQDNEMPQDRSMVIFEPYVLWDVDGKKFGLMNNETGEIGIFDKEKLAPHLHEFFRQNF